MSESTLLKASTLGTGDRLRVQRRRKTSKFLEVTKVYVGQGWVAVWLRGEDQESVLDPKEMVWVCKGPEPDSFWVFREAEGNEMKEGPWVVELLGKRIHFFEHKAQAVALFSSKTGSPPTEEPPVVAPGLKKIEGAG
jgi:hypothetical protein